MLPAASCSKFKCKLFQTKSCIPSVFSNGQYPVMTLTRVVDVAEQHSCLRRVCIWLCLGQLLGSMSFFSANAKSAKERAVEEAVLKLKKTCHWCSAEFRSKLHYKAKLQAIPGPKQGSNADSVGSSGEGAPTF